MDLKENKKFFITIGVTIVVLIVLLMLRKPVSYDVIVFEDINRETFELSLQDINRFKGIDFDRLSISEAEEFDENISYNKDILKRFYDKYKEEKGNSLKKVFLFDSVLALTTFRNYDYYSITFHSAEGARIKVTPTEIDDYLILLTLEQHSGNYSMRLILPADSFSQRWLKNINRIVLE